MYIAVEPDVALNYDQLGPVYSSLDNDEKAELAFPDALRRDSTLGGSFIGLAKVYQKRGKYAEALKALNSGGAGQLQRALLEGTSITENK